MLKRHYEILLPLQFNDGSENPRELFSQTREELVDRFGAVSVLPGTIAGIWHHEGTRYEDSLVRFTVDAQDTPEDRQSFVTWEPTLLARFQQIQNVHHFHRD